ncbi:hypothetical protein ACFLZW_04215 [Chloroflexota bacterium]
MKIPNIYIENIQTRNLLYYDPDFKDVCFNFCQERDIDCLPSLGDPMVFYRKTETGFCEDDMTSKQMVDSGAYIFERSLLERFRENPLLFVFKKCELIESIHLTGVVHFSDYNRLEVSAYLFGMFSDYERSLRRLLILQGLNNQDMLDHFQVIIESKKSDKTREIYTNKIAGYERKRDRNEKLPRFEMFYLRDLIELAGRQNILNLGQDVNDLRNMVMHAHEFIKKDDASRDEYIYNFSSFETFFTRVSRLLGDYKKVNNKIAFMELAQG